MPETFSVADSAELAVVVRNDFVESRHTGSAIVLAPNGTILRQIGNPYAPILPRSAMKPFQAVALLTTGLELTNPEAAIAMGSHSGTPQHVELITSMLMRSGLQPENLQCPKAWPSDTHARDQRVRNNTGPSRLTMTCSGKHAAMLMACVHNKWDISHYLQPDHPAQTHIREMIERLTGEKITTTAIDGCGAPVHAMSLHALARGTQRIATAEATSPFALFRNAAKLRHSVLENAWAVDGPGSINTLIIEQLGVFMKWGAEGMMIMSAPDGTTATLKVLDGTLRAATIIALALLTQSHSLSTAHVAALLPQLHLDILGGDQIVGSIRPTV
jgi:L-asparaginase II